MVENATLLGADAIVAVRFDSSEIGQQGLSNGDREQLYDQLARHAAAGRLDVEELERRVTAVAVAQTRQQAAAVLADLPPLAAPATTPGATGRPHGRRGHGEAERPAADWRPTGERFRDPRSKRVLRVWVDPGGGRHHVPDDSR
jgi:DUF1707 SHOCT-like domain